jgi:hypothetical protein
VTFLSFPSGVGRASALRRPCCAGPSGCFAVLGLIGVGLELAALRQSPALIRSSLRSSAAQKGSPERRGTPNAMASVRFQANGVGKKMKRFVSRRPPPKSDPLAGCGMPWAGDVWRCRAAQQRADQGGRLFERSEFEPAPARCEQRRVARRASDFAPCPGHAAARRPKTLRASRHASRTLTGTKP